MHSEVVPNLFEMVETIKHGVHEMSQHLSMCEASSVNSRTNIYAAWYCGLEVDSHR